MNLIEEYYLKSRIQIYMDCIHDYRINADNYSLNMTISEYYELVKDCLNDNEYQRKRVRNSSSIYNLLKQDIIKGCVMPPIVLALCLLSVFRLECHLKQHPHNHPQQYDAPQ